MPGGIRTLASGTSVRWVPNVAGIQAAGAAAGTVGVAILAKKVLERAQEIAPVDTGAFRDSLYAEPGGKIRDAKTGRYSGQNWIVASDIRYAVFLEFGTSTTPTFATLRRALYETRL